MRLSIVFSVLLLELCTAPLSAFVLLERSKVASKATIHRAQKKASRGFGSPSPSTSSSPVTGDAKIKVRSLSSGHAGSGTKVLRKAANLFDSIRKAHGVAACSDVYVRAPLNNSTTFWFVGKVAFQNKATASQAVLAQKRLILEYSKSELRPQNLGGSNSKTLELWLAPGDSEMDTVQNKITLQPVVGSVTDLPADFNLDNVGYNPEIYVGEERIDGGLRVQRDDQGRPIQRVFDVKEAAS
jgi:hypothetical protein